MMRPTPPSPTRVIVGTDFSWPSIDVISWLGREFLPDVELVLVHALDVPEPAGLLHERDAPDTLSQVATEGARRRLQALRRAIGREDASYIVRRGPASVVLPAVARELVADLIAVGPHRRRHGLWDRLGTTAEKLLSRTPVPVLLVPFVPAQPPTRVLVPVDDAAAPTEATRWARLMADRLHGRVSRVHVVGAAVPTHLLVPAHASAVTAGGDWPGAAPDSGVERWRDSFPGAEPAAPGVETCFGEAGEEIIATAERRGDCMIVMGRQRAGAVRRALLGSVTREVLRGTPCPVLVVPEHA